MTILFKTQYGSRLYGTATPTSDTDWKTIYLPSLDDLLLGKRLVNKFKTTNPQEGERNGADDVDTELIPLQVFLRDFYEGQTYAIELAFAIDGTHAGQEFNQYHESWFKDMVHQLREQFLTSNVQAMVGYATHQANLYSLKGERLNTVVAAKEALDTLSRMPGVAPSTRFDDLSPEVTGAVFANMPSNKYFRIGTYMAAEDKPAPCFYLLSKVFPFSISIASAQKRVDAMASNYGGRARDAAKDNVDWKAMMHAIRISDQTICLLETGTLELPLDNQTVAYLLSIKRGEQSFELVSDQLADNLEFIKDLQTRTHLPARSLELDEAFQQFQLRWLHNWYHAVYF